MVATKVLISMCMVALVRAAPQLDLPIVPVAYDQQVIVSNVVTALQPSIAQAVADALRSLSFTSGTFSSSSGSSESSQISGSSQFAGSSQISGSAGIAGSAAAGISAGAISGSAEYAPALERDLVTTRPEYTFEWKVADDDEQTYINQAENRDGDDVTGSYSYVDANGDLITINYQAGAMGFTQTMDKTVGAVQMRARPAKVSVASESAQSSSASSGSSSTTGFASGSTSSTGGAASGFNSGSSTRFSSSSTTSGAAFDSSALIAQIMRVLRPQIVIAVDNAVAQL